MDVYGGYKDGIWQGMSVILIDVTGVVSQKSIDDTPVIGGEVDPTWKSELTYSY